MTLPLDGRRIALAEGRQLEELAALLAKEGATPLRVPLISILDAPDPAPVAPRPTQLQLVTPHPVIEIADVVKAYGTGRVQVTALAGVTLIDERTFDGTIEARVGPISGDFGFRAHIVDSDPPRQLKAEVEPCSGHGPRYWPARVRLAGQQPSSSRTAAMVIAARTAAKSMAGVGVTPG